jgi:hypothetical protein
MKCQCGRTVILGAGSHNRWYQSYCSHYCSIYYQNPSQYPDVKKSDSKHHKGHFRRPDIVINCDLCEKQFSLRDAEKDGNRHFCSNECFRKLLKTKHGHRDWTILKLIQLYGPISADEIANRYCTNVTVMSGRGIGSILRVYRARNIVNDVVEIQGFQRRRYKLQTKQPLAKVVVEKLKVK